MNLPPDDLANTNLPPDDTASTTPLPDSLATATPSPDNTASTTPSSDGLASTTPSPDGLATATPSPDDTASTTPSSDGLTSTTPLPDSLATTTSLPDDLASTTPSPDDQDTPSTTSPKETGKKSSPGRVGLKLLQWAIFTVVIALLPIVLNSIRLDATPRCTSSQTKDCLDPHFNILSSAIAEHGDLALVCSVITAEAIGEMFMIRQTRSAAQLFSFGWCCIIFFLSAGVFVRALSNNPDVDVLKDYSLAMFVGTLFAGGTCKAYVAYADTGE